MTNTNDEQDDLVEAGDVPSDEQWGTGIRLRVGTRRRLEELVDLLSDPNRSGSSILPEEVAQVFREAFKTSRRAYTPDVLVDTAVAALRHMLLTPPPEEPEQRKPAKNRGR